MPTRAKDVEPRRRERRWAGVREAAAYAGFKERAIRQRIADGDLPAYKPAGSRVLRVDLNDVDDFIERDGRIPAGHLDLDEPGSS
jgi:excisionase family DNA binding protein